MIVFETTNFSYYKIKLFIVIKVLFIYCYYFLLFFQYVPLYYLFSIIALPLDKK